MYSDEEPTYKSLKTPKSTEVRKLLSFKCGGAVVDLTSSVRLLALISGRKCKRIPH